MNRKLEKYVLYALGEIAVRRVRVYPVAGGFVEAHEQVELVAFDLAEALVFVVDDHELDEAGFEERMLVQIEFSVGWKHSSIRIRMPFCKISISIPFPIKPSC